MPTIPPNELPAERIDGRTIVAKRLRRFRAGLIADLGGEPTAAQSSLIELAITVKRKLLLWDASGEPPKAHYLVWTNAPAKLLVRLDPKARLRKPGGGRKPHIAAPPSAPRSLAEVIHDRRPV